MSTYFLSLSLSPSLPLSLHLAHSLYFIPITLPALTLSCIPSSPYLSLTRSLYLHPHSPTYHQCESSSVISETLHLYPSTQESVASSQHGQWPVGLCGEGGKSDTHTNSLPSISLHESKKSRTETNKSIMTDLPVPYSSLMYAPC